LRDFPADSAQPNADIQEMLLERSQSSKHKCLLPSTSEINIASELCTTEKPCLMNSDKISLHYVIHYIKRGVWDNVVPKLEEADKPRVEAYQCNICNKKFRNNHSKQEYPGRGSFICHFATEHGKIIDAMRNDDLVDMEAVINILEVSDERLAKFVKDGTKTAHDQNPVKIVESITWRIQQDGFNANSNPSSQNSRKNVRSVIKCPKCKEFDRNKDPNNLKLHIFHHYLEFWDTKVPKMSTKETVCEQCTPQKRIVGANPEGCRTAMICHRAMHHDELRIVLENDTELPEGFIGELFGEVSAKPVKVMRAGGNKISDEDTDKKKQEQNVREERERIAQEVRKREMIRIFEKRKKEEKVKTVKDDRPVKRKKTEETQKEKDERLKDKMLELQKRLEEKTMYWNNRNS